MLTREDLLTPRFDYDEGSANGGEASPGRGVKTGGFMGLAEGDGVKRVLITGASGQDAAYLAKSCIASGDLVFATARPTSDLAHSPLGQMGIAGQVTVLRELLDSVDTARSVLRLVEPDEVFNLAGRSSVFESFADPVVTAQANAMGPLYLLQAVRLEGGAPRFVQASTGEVFGSAAGVCREESPVAPASPYASTKVFAQHMTKLLRETAALKASVAILFSHESPYRGQQFLTRKVTITMAKIRHGKADLLELGNLSARRDWGFAGDYVEGMRLIAESAVPADYVLASGEARSVREFVSAAATCFGYELEWSGDGLDEVGRDQLSGQVIVRVNPQFFRPTDTADVVGCPDRAERELGWRRTTSFEELVSSMAKADNDRVARGEL